jgi:hypothetical protein
MFQRFFGVEKKKDPAPSLDDVSKRASGRVTELDEKIGKMDAEARQMASFVFFQVNSSFSSDTN